MSNWSLQNDGMGANAAAGTTASVRAFRDGEFGSDAGTGVLCALRRDVPVLDATRDVVEDRVRKTGHVADCVNIRPNTVGCLARIEVAVGDHTVRQVDVLAFQPLDVGVRADCLDENVTGNLGAVIQANALDHGLADQVGHAATHRKLGAVVLLAAHNLGGKLATERAKNWQFARANHGHIGAELASGCRGLASDEARTKNHDASAWAKCRAQFERIIEAANHVATDGQVIRVVLALRAQSGGYDELRILDLFALVGLDHTALEVGAGDAGAELPFDIRRGRTLRKSDRLEAYLGRQHLFRERRTVVRRVMLIANRNDRPGIAESTQRLCRAQSAHGCADDYDWLGHGESSN
jgi:hypothetical protein